MLVVVRTSPSPVRVVSSSCYTLPVPTIEHLVLSPSHVYVGHFGKPPGTEPAVERDEVRLLPGHGIDGDRYAAREAGHKKQISFFAMEVLEELGAHFGKAVAPGAVRRNVFTRGIDLLSLVGKRFTLQGVTFEGVEHCKPCFWMNTAVGDGAEELLKPGKGGLRASIVEGERLRVGPAPLVLSD